jgi:phage terminase large subunit
MREVSATLNFERLVNSTFPAYSSWLGGKAEKLELQNAETRKIWNLPGEEYRATRKRYAVLEGSSGSSKTISILQYLLTFHLLRRKVKVDCFRHDQATCNDSVIEDFRFVMGPDQFGLWDDRCWNEQRKEYRFKNGSMLRFRGCQKPGKLHGPRRDIAWLNEVTEISYESFRQINARTNDFIIMDFNPSLSVHWVFERILKQGTDRVDYFHSTFMDNPFISPEARADILSWKPTTANVLAGTADKWSWEVYGLGKRARREGAIFDNWHVLEDEQWPKELYSVQRDGHFVDFGYSQDPTAVGRAFLLRDKLYVREIIYEKGLITTVNQTNPDKPSLELRLREAIECGLFLPGLVMVGDCAAAEPLADLEASGFLVEKCDKSGGITYGINLLKQFTICVHRDSTNLQAEFENYAWKKRADGTVSDEPMDQFNHLIDGLRYWAVRNVKPRALVVNHARGKGRVAGKLRRY